MKEQELYPFKDESQQALFNKVSTELRCIVCENQSLFDSRAPAALALRQAIYQEIRSGKSEQEILNAVVSQYGDAVSYRPAFKLDTYMLWSGPVLMIVFGCLLLRKILR